MKSTNISQTTKILWHLFALQVVRTSDMNNDIPLRNVDILKSQWYLTSKPFTPATNALMEISMQTQKQDLKLWLVIVALYNKNKPGSLGGQHENLKQ